MARYYWRFRITNKCNANCIFCHGEGFDRRSEECFMPFDFFKSVLYKASINDNISITGGEPLLHPNVIEMINLTVDRVNNNCHLNTNGILLYNNLIQLSKTKLNKIHINLSTLNKILYYQIYKIPFPGKLIQSLYLAKDLNFSITINSIILEGVNDSLDNINSLLKMCLDNSFDLCFIEPYKQNYNIKTSKIFQEFFKSLLFSKNMSIEKEIPGRIIYKSVNNTTVTIAAPCSPAQAENGTINEDAFVVMENQIIKRFNKKDTLVI